MKTTIMTSLVALALSLPIMAHAEHEELNEMKKPGGEMMAPADKDKMMEKEKMMMEKKEKEKMMMDKEEKEKMMKEKKY